jgi:hypothetical protein
VKNVSNSPAPKKQVGLQLGFTKENELFVGRAAMLGFAFSLIGELLTGKGALAQLGYEVFDDKLGTLQIDELVSLIACAGSPIHATLRNPDHSCNLLPPRTGDWPDPVQPGGRHPARIRHVCA